MHILHNPICCQRQTQNSGKHKADRENIPDGDGCNFSNDDSCTSRAEGELVAFEKETPRWKLMTACEMPNVH